MRVLVDRKRGGGVHDINQEREQGNSRRTNELHTVVLPILQRHSFSTMHLSPVCSKPLC